MEKKTLEMLREIGMIPSEEEMADRYIGIAFLLLNCAHTKDILPDDKVDAFSENVARSFLGLGVSQEEIEFALDEIVPLITKQDEFHWTPEPAESSAKGE